MALLFFIAIFLDTLLCPILDDAAGNYTTLSALSDQLLGLAGAGGGVAIPNIGDLMRGCKYNEPLLSVIDLAGLGIDLDADTIYDQVESANLSGKLDGFKDISLGDTNFFSNETRSDLLRLKNATDIDFTDLNNNLAANLTSADTAGLIVLLTTAQTAFTGAGAANQAAKMQDMIDNVTYIQNTGFPEIEQSRTDVGNSVTRLQAGTSGIGTAVDGAVAAGDSLQNYMDTQASAEVSKHATAFGQRMLSYVNQFVDYEVNFLFNILGRCGIIFKTFSGFADWLCSGLLEPFMGWTGAACAVMVLYLFLICANSCIAKWYVRHKYVTDPSGGGGSMRN